MTDFTPWTSLIGGALVGLSASLFLLSHGKVAGISGLWGGIFAPETTDRDARVAFVLGLVVAGLAAHFIAPEALGAPKASTWLTAVAGVLVGFGTRMGNGCTSGHGVCGISRLSTRSLVATVTFLAFGMLTVGLTHLLGGAQ